MGPPGVERADESDIDDGPERRASRRQRRRGRERSRRRGRRGWSHVAVAPNAPLEDLELLEGSNGRYYTAWQVRRRLRIGEWRRCLRQREPGPDRRLVETDEGALLMLTPIEPANVPCWLEVRVVGEATLAVDTRRCPSRRPAVQP